MQFLIGLGIVTLMVTTYFFFDVVQFIVLVSLVLAIEGAMAYVLLFKMTIPLWQGALSFILGNVVIFALPILGALSCWLFRKHD